MNPFVEGVVQRVKPAAALTNQLKKASVRDRPTILCQQWYLVGRDRHYCPRTLYQTPRPNHSYKLDTTSAIDVAQKLCPRAAPPVLSSKTSPKMILMSLWTSGCVTLQALARVQLTFLSTFSSRIERCVNRRYSQWHCSTTRLPNASSKRHTIDTYDFVCHQLHFSTEAHASMMLAKP